MIRRQPWRQCRSIHGTARAAKNPYYFYDLQRQQPVASPQAEDASFAAGHRTFDPLATQSAETMQQRVRRVFGDLGSREESRKEAMAKGITVAGIHVPARPEEPTNCCMSGCVDCVWELYKEELEDWRALRKKAREKLESPEYSHVKWPPLLGSEPPNRASGTVSTDEDFDDGEDDINAGIKVFIETEKKIKARRSARAQKQQQTQQHTHTQRTQQASHS